MTHQEHLSSLPAQETCQEDFLLPSEEQLEGITGAGLTGSKEAAQTLLAPQLVRTPSGRVARNAVDVIRAFNHIRQQEGSRLAGQYIQGVPQQDVTYHMITHPEEQRDASIAIYVPES